MEAMKQEVEEQLRPRHLCSQCSEEPHVDSLSFHTRPRVPILNVDQRRDRRQDAIFNQQSNQ
jgi:hypothetical protein